MINNVVDFKGKNEEKKDVLQLNAKVYEQEPVYFYCKKCREIEALTNISLIASCIVSDTTTEAEMDDVAKRLTVDISNININIRCAKCGNEMNNVHPIEATVTKGLEDKGYIVESFIISTKNETDMLFDITIIDSIAIPSVPNIEYWDYNETTHKLSINMKHRNDFGLVAGADEFLKKCITELFTWVNNLPD